MQRWTIRALLTAILTAGVATATARAEEPGCAKEKSHERRHSVSEWFQSRPVITWVHSHEFNCLSSINSLGCGSLKSECTFMFGSCRDFYGETCFKDPMPFRKQERAPVVGPYPYPYP